MNRTPSSGKDGPSCLSPSIWWPSSTAPPGCSPVGRRSACSLSPSASTPGPPSSAGSMRNGSSCWRMSFADCAPAWRGSEAAALVANNQRFIPLLATALLAFAAYVVGAFLYPGMRDPQVFFNILTNNSYLLISSVGMTLVILSGGIDLSVSGVIALTTVATAAMLREGANPWLVVLVVLLMGMALGATMGGFIAYLKVQPFIATLAGMGFSRGVCFFIRDEAIALDHPFFRILS